jgi:hypothetical protein
VHLRPPVSDVSTRSCTGCGGAAVTRDTAIATAKFTMAPTTPKAFGSMPKNQFSPGLSPRKAVPGMNMMPLCWNT